MRTKKEVQAYCDANGIELSIEAWAGGMNHVHLNIDAPHKIFKAHDVHNLGVWDDAKPADWKYIGKQIMEADFGDCTNPDCEYCNGE